MVAFNSPFRHNMLCFFFLATASAILTDCGSCRDSVSCLTTVQTTGPNVRDSFQACICSNKALVESCMKLQCDNEIEKQILTSFEVHSVCNESAIPDKTLILIDLLRYSKERSGTISQKVAQNRITVIVVLFVAFVILIPFVYSIVLSKLREFDLNEETVRYWELRNSQLYVIVRPDEDLPRYLPRYEDINYGDLTEASDL